MSVDIENSELALEWKDLIHTSRASNSYWWAAKIFNCNRRPHRIQCRLGSLHSSRSFSPERPTQNKRTNLGLFASGSEQFIHILCYNNNWELNAAEDLAVLALDLQLDNGVGANWSLLWNGEVHGVNGSGVGRNRARCILQEFADVGLFAERPWDEEATDLRLERCLQFGGLANCVEFQPQSARLATSDLAILVIAIGNFNGKWLWARIACTLCMAQNCVIC